jgi:hypothetical protein
MSTRTEVIGEFVDTMNSGRNIGKWVDANTTDDCVFFATAVGEGETRGRAAMTHILEEFVAQAAPRWRLDGDLVEHGNFVVAFLIAESGTGTASVCELYRFDGDQVSGVWGVRG